MLIVKVENGDRLEKALKIFKRKTISTKLIRELNSRREYEKPSVKRRKQISKAVYKNKKEMDF